MVLNILVLVSYYSFIIKINRLIIKLFSMIRLRPPSREITATSYDMVKISGLSTPVSVSFLSTQQRFNAIRPRSLRQRKRRCKCCKSYPSVCLQLESFAKNNNLRIVTNVNRPLNTLKRVLYDCVATIRLPSVFTTLIDC